MAWENRITRSGMENPKNLVSNPKNWRKHPKIQEDAMRGVLEDIGWIQDIIVNERTGKLVDGHLRVEIALKNGESEVPVKYVDLLEEEEEKALITFDPITAMAEADKELLNSLVERCKTDNEEVKGLLADIAEKEKLEFGKKEIVDDDFESREPETIETKIQRGDILLLGRHRVMCGDSTSAGDVGRLMDGEKADLLLTDPPYGVSYVGKTKDALTIENDALTEEGLEELIRGAFSLAEANCRPGAYWYATVPPGPLHLLFADDWKARGILRQIMVWVKDSMVLGHSEYHYQHEPILFGWMPGERYKNPDRTRTTVWECPRPKASREHPTTKPVALWARAVQDGSREADLVFDPFLGSGTTLVAAEQLGRACYGMEISPQYCEVICQRWEKLTGEKRTIIGGCGTNA
jgi:DNA modification methylase